MRFFFSTLFLLLASSFFLIAQDLNYNRLTNQGKLPKDYTIPSQQKYEKIIVDHNGNKQSRKKSTRDEFYLTSTYAIDNLIRSGYVLFNDPISKYVNEVLSEITEKNPKIKEKKPRAYILKSTAVNAFAVDQGIIFISIGLLSQLENEAQLALILSHELVHIMENHGLEGFLEAERVDKYLKKNRRVKIKQINIANLEKNRYSRDQELEADDKGLDYFLNTDYNFKSIHRVFDVLRYAYLPYDEVVFEKSILEKLSVKIPEEYFLEEINPINPAEEDEEQSTHPALSKRSRNFNSRLKGLETGNKKNYIISKKRFDEIQLKSRIELARLFLERQLLSEAIYSGFLMTKIYGNSNFAKEIIGEALYGYAKFKNNNATGNVSSPYYKNIEGESQQVYYLMDKLSNEELIVLAIAYNYDRYKSVKENNTLRSLIIDLFSDLYLKHDVNSLTAFYSIKKDTLEIEDNRQSKIDKIKQNRKKSEETTWHRLAFSEVLNDSTFRNIANEGFALGKNLKKRNDYFDTDTFQGRSNLEKYRKEVDKKGQALGINKVLLINPVFIHLKGRLNNLKPGLIEGDKRQESLKNIIKSSAENQGVMVQILDSNNLQEDDTEVLNDIVSANEWIDTQLDAQGFLYQAYNQKEIESITQKYGTPYIMSVFIVSAKVTNPIKRLFNKKPKSFIFVSVFDTKTGYKFYIKSDFKSNYLSDVFLKSELYDAFNQLSKSN